MTEKFWHLTNCNLFAQLTADQIRQVESRSRSRKVQRNSPVYLPAEQADGVLLLVSGRIKICHISPEGKQSILTFVEPGELFGELAIFESGKRDEYAEAVDHSHVILIPADEMQRLIAEHPNFSIGITKLIGFRRRRIERRLKYLLFRSNRERLVHLILELAEQYGAPSPEGVALKIKLSHQDLASIIGSTRETVTVLLGDLQASGMIKLGRRTITIVKIQAMANSVNTEPPNLEPRSEPAQITSPR